jgi:hypothetical protein
MIVSRSMRFLFVVGTAAILAAVLPRTSVAAVRVDASILVQAAHGPRLDVDVWTNKEEGGVYRQGEPMRVSFRSSADAFVLIYNIDTDGYIHLVYPYGPNDPDRVEGGRTYQVPSRNDPYDLVADGPAGIEYIVAIASPLPFRDLPWYLTGGYDGPPRGGYDDDDYEESGVIVGDPYVGMDRVVRRVVPPGAEDEVATADTYFYIERHVDYPRYVCADCHSYGGWYDPYVDVCSVIDIRIDATWARFRPLRSGVIRPRYYYMVRSTAPSRYRQWKDRWSSVDGRTTLRTRFQVDGQDKFRARRETIQRRTPPEFQNLRRPRSGRTWSKPDQVIRRSRDRDDATQRERGNLRERRDNTPDRRDEARDRQESRQREGQQMRERQQEQQRQRDEGLMRERRQEQQRQRGESLMRERRQERERSMRERSQQRPENRGSQGDRGRGNDERRRDDSDRGRGNAERRRDDSARERPSEERRRDDTDRGRSSDERPRDDDDRRGNGRGRDRDR